MVICYVMLYVKADPYILGVWPVTVICVKWASIGRSTAIASRVNSDTFYSNLKTVLFSNARIGSAPE